MQPIEQKLLIHTSNYHLNLFHVYSLFSFEGQFCISMGTLPFGQVFSLLLTKKTAMYSILCRHARFDWQSTKAFLYVIGKYNIMLTWNYIIANVIKGKHNVRRFTKYPLQKYLPTRKQTLTNLNFETRELNHCQKHFTAYTVDRQYISYSTV